MRLMVSHGAYGERRAWWCFCLVRTNGSFSMCLNCLAHQEDARLQRAVHHTARRSLRRVWGTILTCKRLLPFWEPEFLVQMARQAFRMGEVDTAHQLAELACEQHTRHLSGLVPSGR